MDFTTRPIRQLIIESHNTLGSLVNEIRRQTEGGYGDFTLREGDSDLEFDKSVSMFVDPFEADANNKPIINGLIKSLVSLGLSEANYLTTEETVTSLVRYCQKIAFENDSDVMMNPPFLESIFKLMRPEFPLADELKERLSDFVSLVSRYTDNRLLIFVNVSSFLSAEDYFDLVKQLEYLQHPVLMIESHDTQYIVPKKIIDVDLCEIDVS